MANDTFEKHLAALGNSSSLASLNVAMVAEALATISNLAGTEAGLKTVQTRTGDWKSWDPDVYGVDEAAEGGYIARLREMNRPIVMLSEESERVDINTDQPGDPIYCVSDPFDGSWLFKRQMPHWWYTSLAFFKTDFTPISSATADIKQNLIACCDDDGAYLLEVTPDGFGEKETLNEAYRQKLAGNAPTSLNDACIESYGLKPKKYLLPLLKNYTPVIEAFKMFYPNGGPYAFVDVATGQVDVYFAMNQPYVDIFSGLEIARKAGCVISDLDGNPFRLNTDDCKTTHNVIASRNQQIHDMVLERFAACTK